MKHIVSLLLLCLSASSAFCASEPAKANLIGNVGGRKTLSLNGTWRIIVDPYETGLGARYFENRKPKDKSDRVEYDLTA